MYNNEIYTLDKIADDGKGYTINDKIFTKNELSAYFYVLIVQLFINIKVMKLIRITIYMI